MARKSRAGPLGITPYSPLTLREGSYGERLGRGAELQEVLQEKSMEFGRFDDRSHVVV